MCFHSVNMRILLKGHVHELDVTALPHLTRTLYHNYPLCKGMQILEILEDPECPVWTVVCWEDLRFELGCIAWAWCGWNQLLGVNFYYPGRCDGICFELNAIVPFTAHPFIPQKEGCRFFPSALQIECSWHLKHYEIVYNLHANGRLEPYS